MSEPKITAGYSHIGEIGIECALIFNPPERLTPSESAAKYVYIKVEGAWDGLYSNDQAPYMIEPQDTFVSRVFNGMIFVGPAQCGKTQSLILNTVAYSIKVDPMDMIIYCPTSAAARDFSMRRIDRLHFNSPDIGNLLRPDRDADNVFDKHYKTGMILTMSHPSRTEFAGRPIGRVVLTDRDRMDDDIDGEGEPFDLAIKRTTTFRSFAMCVAESSPSRPITDSKWVRKTPHEPPPCKGILGLYARGDRRRLYWPCPSCGSYFEGNFRMLRYENRDVDASIRMLCPAVDCDYQIHPDERYDMLKRAKWVKDFQTIDKDGIIHGDGPRTKIASFWLNGVAAAFVTWAELAHNYIAANEAYERTGEEEALIKFYNNDLGEPYKPKSMEADRLPEVLQARSEDLGGSEDNPVVPHGVRLLIATIDVQKNMFIVQVHGVLPGTPFDTVIVDRFKIHLSDDRLDDDGQVEWVKPGTYLEDWDLLTEKVIKRTYPLADGSGRRMIIKLTGCDSGGKAGVTANAYDYFRKLRREGLGGRFILVKGTGLPTAPITKINYPDSNNTKLKAAAQGDVPVLMLQSNKLKDIASNRLDCMLPGKGLVRYPEWLPDWFYSELCSEVRTEKGWDKPAHARNEAWDLFYYFIGVCVSPLIKIESFDWENPQAWYAPWETNNLISEPDRPERFALTDQSRYDFAALGRKLA
jgi:phage terminase large subunit GpA-like protein